MGQTSRGRLLGYLASLIPQLVWWIVFYPGTFSVDSIEVVQQIRSGSWNDWHTNAYTTFVWVSSLGGNHWGLVSLIQVLLLSAGIASLGSALVSNGTSVMTVCTANFLLASLPQVGGFAVTVWKDVPSTAGTLMLAAALIELTATKKSSKASFFLLSLGALLMAAFRWNGPVTLAIVCVGLLLLYRRAVLRSTVVIFLGLLLGAASLVIPQRLALTSATSWLNFEVRELHDISYAYAKHPMTFNASEKELLVSIMPLNYWLDGGNSCEGVEVLQYEGLRNFEPNSYESVRLQHRELRHLWRELLLRDPLSIATARLCRAGGALSPIFFGRQPTLGVWTSDSSDPELQRPRYFERAEEFLRGLGEVRLQTELRKTIFYNASLWTLLALIVLWLSPRARTAVPAVAVGISVIVSVALLANAHDARYVAGALLVAQYLCLTTTLQFFLKLMSGTWLPDSIRVSRRRAA